MECTCSIQTVGIQADPVNAKHLYTKFSKYWEKNQTRKAPKIRDYEISCLILVSMTVFLFLSPLTTASVISFPTLPVSSVIPLLQPHAFWIHAVFRTRMVMKQKCFGLGMTYSKSWGAVLNCPCEIWGNTKEKNLLTSQLALYYMKSLIFYATVPLNIYKM